MSASLGQAPGFQRHPQHQIEIRPATTRWQVRSGDEVLADSNDALVLEETRYAPAIYFPRADVRIDQLADTDTKTTCPFKGEASYYQVDSSTAGDDIAWTYPVTYDEVSLIAGYIAFYADRVSMTELEN